MSATEIAQVGIGIVGDDRTKTAFDSATKRAKKVGGEVKKIGGETAKLGASSSGLKGFAKTLGDVEKGASELFGGKSAFGGIAGKIGAIRKLGSTIGEGFGRASVSMSSAGIAGGEAAEGMEAAAGAASLLEGAMAGAAIVGGTVVGVLGAAAVVGFKVSESFSKSAASVGRLSETIGVAAGDLQKLQGAAERYGIDKNTSAGALGSFAQTVHDARYGRNNSALALMARMGVGFRTKADGTLDYNAMMLDTADALKRQKDPQTALMAANHLGVSGLLPMLRRGSGTVKAEMADVGVHGGVISDRGIALGTRQARDAVIRGQAEDHAIIAGKEGVQRVMAPVSGGLARASQGLVDGSVKLDGAAGKIGGAAETLGGAAGKLLAAVDTSLADAAVIRPRQGSKSSQGLGPKFDGSFASAIHVFGERSRDDQVSPRGARGYMQVMPRTAHHPGMGIRAVANESLAEYDRVGIDYANALLRRYGGDWALASASYNAGTAPVDRWIKRFGDPRKGQISDRDWIAHIPGHGPRTYEETRRYTERVYHVHEFKGLPAGASVRSKTDGRPNVSMSFGY